MGVCGSILQTSGAQGERLKVGGEAGPWARGVLVIFYGTHYPLLCVHTPHPHTCPSVGMCQACTCVHVYVHKSVAGSGIYSRACSNSPSSF